MCIRDSAGVSQSLRRSIEGTTYVRQGDHHVGHWPTFLVYHSYLTVTVLDELDESITILGIKHINNSKKVIKLEMWANAQPDGRPDERRWCLLLNAANFG